jgi:predicted O-linked N-acetylglucosamine transferase (SPINDLY family)
LPELVGDSPQEYQDIAILWARNLEGLAALRAGLRQRMQRSALMNGKQYAQDIEAALRGMWASWAEHRRGGAS